MAKQTAQSEEVVLRFEFCAFALRCHSPAWAVDGARNELPAPFNLQAVVLEKTITLSWQWPRPEELPAFTQLGYEVKRNDGKTFLAMDTTYADSNLVPSTYSYVVRVRGLAKEKGKKVTYVSDWSEPAGGTIKTHLRRSADD